MKFQAAGSTLLVVLLCIWVRNGATDVPVVEALEGEEKTLICNYTDGTRSTQIKWYHKRQGAERYSTVVSDGMILNGYIGQFLIDRDISGTYHLTIRSARLSDTGLFACSGDSEYKNIIETRLIVQRTDSNEPVVHYPSFVDNSFALPCNSPTPVTMVDWYVKRSWEQPAEKVFVGSMMNGFQDRMHYDNSNSRKHKLVIHNVNVSDAGIYICQHESRRIYMRLSVFKLTSVANYARWCTVGTQTSLPCSRQATSSLTSWWTKSSSTHDFTKVATSDHVETAFEERLVVSSSASGHYNLTVRCNNVTDSGDYTCIEDLRNGSAARSIIALNVSDLPTPRSTSPTRPSIRELFTPSLRSAPTTHPTVPGHETWSEFVKNLPNYARAIIVILCLTGFLSCIVCVLCCANINRIVKGRSLWIRNTNSKHDASEAFLSNVYHCETRQNGL